MEHTHLDPNRLALAATGTMFLTYLICVIFVSIAPELALKFTGWMFHIINVEKLGADIGVTFGSAFLGMLPLLLYSYIFGWLFGWMYNKLVR